MSARFHRLIRFFALLIMVPCLAYMARRCNIQKDMTSEGLSELTPETLALIDSTPTDRPVVVTAFVSQEVPQEYVATRTRLLNILRTMQSSGNEALMVRIYEPEYASEEAEMAVDKYGIVPRQLLSSDGGSVGAIPVFLGLSIQSGANEEIIPFLDRGLSVEYELVRALRSVITDERRVIGVIRTDANLMGSFDIQTRRQIPAWRIVNELSKQYEVRSLGAENPVPPDVDVVLVPQVSSLTQAGLDNLNAYVAAGRPALIVADPLPAFNIKLSPTQDMLPPPGAGMNGPAQPGPPKGDYVSFLRRIGVDWIHTRIVYDKENPNPRLKTAPPHVVFVGTRDGVNTLEGGDPIVDGLAQVVVLFGGQLAPAPEADVSFTPLLTTGTQSGYDEFERMIDPGDGFLRPMSGPIIPREKGPAIGEPVVLAARLANADGVNVIVLSDLDMLADTFFAFNERGGDLDGDGLLDIRFDNVAFLLNAIDTLAGDESLVGLRKRQPTFRPLEKMDEMTADANEAKDEKIAAADKAATDEIEAAQKKLDETVAAIRARDDLDETQKQNMARAAQDTENRRLEAKRKRLELEKQRAIEKIRAEHIRAVNEERDKVRANTILLPPIPPILLGIFVLIRKRRREQSTIPAARTKAGAKTGTKAEGTPQAKTTGGTQS